MDDTQNLIDGLCTWAGMIMEDVSAVAIVRGDKSEAVSKIEQIGAAAADIGVLAEAAEVILRRGESPPKP